MPVPIESKDKWFSYEIPPMNQWELCSLDLGEGRIEKFLVPLYSLEYSVVKEAYSFYILPEFVLAYQYGGRIRRYRPVTYILFGHVLENRRLTIDTLKHSSANSARILENDNLFWNLESRKALVGIRDTLAPYFLQK